MSTRRCAEANPPPRFVLLSAARRHRLADWVFNANVRIGLVPGGVPSLMFNKLLRKGKEYGLPMCAFSPAGWFSNAHKHPQRYIRGQLIGSATIFT